MSGGVKKSKLATREARDAEHHTPPHDDDSPKRKFNEPVVKAGLGW